MKRFLAARRRRRVAHTQGAARAGSGSFVLAAALAGAALTLTFATAMDRLDLTGARWAQAEAHAEANQSRRALYDLEASLDASAGTLSGRALVQVPASASDPLRDVSFFLFANALTAPERPLLRVQSVRVDSVEVPFTLEGPVLRVALEAPRSQRFEVAIDYRGTIPRSRAGGALDALQGADLSELLAGLLGGAVPHDGDAQAGEAGATRRETADYGLYALTEDTLSLGAFWYPHLAVRREGRWIDEAPVGLGDVAFSEMGDYRARLRLAEPWIVVAPGRVERRGEWVEIEAPNLRELAIVASPDFVVARRGVDLDGRVVRLESFARASNQQRLEETLDVAEAALRIFSRRFGPYLYPELKIVEVPLREGAGGMEYSGLIGIASMLYGSFESQLAGLGASLGLPGVDDALASLGLGEMTEANGLLESALVAQQREVWDSTREATIAHEVAHQWFAIAVGSDSVREPWVDESLVNWATMLYFEERYGPEKAARMIDLHLVANFTLGATLGGGDRPANLPSAAYANSLQYSAVVYGKGALFYVRLRELMGDEAFFAALGAYAERFTGDIADGSSLRALMREAAPDKSAAIEALYARWIEGAHGLEDIAAASLRMQLPGPSALFDRALESLGQLNARAPDLNGLLAR